MQRTRTSKNVLYTHEPSAVTQYTLRWREGPTGGGANGAVARRSAESTCTWPQHCGTGSDPIFEITVPCKGLALKSSVHLFAGGLAREPAVAKCQLRAVAVCGKEEKRDIGSAVPSRAGVHLSQPGFANT